MRKYIISTMCIAVAIMFAASCNKIEEKIPSVDEKRITVINAVAEAVGGGTKAHNQYSCDVLWDKGDKIYVVGKENTNTFTVSDESAGTNKGMFTEDTPSYGIKGDIEAVYPANLKEGNDYVWPAIQAGNQVPPMYARQTISGTGDETVNFSSLGAMLQIVFNSTTPDITGIQNFWLDFRLPFFRVGQNIWSDFSRIAYYHIHQLNSVVSTDR